MFGSGGTRGAARFVEDWLPCTLPVGDVGDEPFSPPGLLVPLLLPPPRNRPLLQETFMLEYVHVYVYTDTESDGLATAGARLRKDLCRGKGRTTGITVRRAALKPQSKKDTSKSLRGFDLNSCTFRETIANAGYNV